MMQRAYYDMAGNYVLPPRDVTLASLGVPPYSPPADDWEDEYPVSSGNAEGFVAAGMTNSPEAESRAWRDGNSASFWIPDDPRAPSALPFEDFVRTIDPRSHPDVSASDAPRYAGWDDWQRYSVPYAPRAAALGAFRIPGLPEDAPEWGRHERSPSRVGGPEMPAQLASMLERLLGLELGTEFTQPRRGGYPSISGGGAGGGGGGSSSGSNAPRGAQPSVSGPIYREGGPSPSN